MVTTLFNFSRRRLSLWSFGRNDSPSGGFVRWFLLLALLVTGVTGMNASDHNPWQDYDIHCPFWAEHYGLDPILFNYDDASSRYYIEWMIVLLDDNGDDELFREDKGHGLTTYIKVGNQDEVYLGNFHSGHKSNSMVDPQLAYYQNNIKLAYWMKSNGEFTNNYFPLGGTWQIVKEWSDETPIAQQIGEYKKGITVRWYIPNNLLNTTITIREEGGWYKYDSDSHYNVNVSKSVTTSYAFSLPAMSWNTNYSVAPDGTITVPYTFEETSDTHTKANRIIASSPTNLFDLSYLTSAGGSAPTEGLSHIATRINGVWNESIGNHDLDGYVPDSYTFNLSDIGMDMRSSFTIQPYVEFTHENDKDANNGAKVYQNFAENLAFKPLGIAENLRAVFDQDSKTVTLTWTGKDAANYPGAHWAVYRGYDRINWLDTNVTTCTDTHFSNEEDVEYCVYYVLPSWNQETKVDNEKATTTVNTTRTVPVNNLQAVSSEDKVTLTWTSRAFPAGMNNKFDIYLNDEKVQTITPVEGQTSFKWEHRDNDELNGKDRVNYNQQQTVEEGLDAYSEEDLDACTAYTYRVVGQIDGKALNSATQANKAIGAGTTFENFVCSKGDNQGSVLLTWNVKRLENDDAETYVIERRVMKADNDDEGWQKLTTLDSDKTFMTWEDKTPLPGVFYEYRVTCYNNCNKTGNRPSITAYDTGFAMSSGVISGRITYGTGTAVGDVKVTLRQNNEDGDAVNHLRSLQFSGPGTGMLCTTSANDMKKLLGKDFSIQAYVHPSNAQMNSDGTAYVLYDASGLFKLLLKYDATQQAYQLGAYINGENRFTDVTIPANQWSHVSCVYSKQAQITTFYITTDANNIASGTITEQAVAAATDETQLALGNSITLDDDNNFGGYLDEFRFFMRALTQNDIKKNYNHPMGGSETDLAIYYPMDENMGNQNFVYDFSKSNNASNGHHATAHVPALSSTYTPTEEQLSLMGMTDPQGNYVIRGVPFSGEGTNYTVVPTMGIHEFSPAYLSRYISASSLVHNGVDFEDVSSFPVSGTVRYAGTDYPVEGCNIYVDGQISSKNGEAVTTNAYGEFSISVPIGDHFIQIVNNGHTFAAAGRYPADPDDLGLLHTFDQKITGLEFIDETLVNFTGRVVGGNIEGEKPVGFGESKNNIGVVELIVSPLNELYRMNVVKQVTETTSSLETNTEEVYVASATTKINSTSVRGANADYCKKIFIRTDPATGEFSAMLPPLQYKVESMKVVKTEQDLNVSTTIDMANPTHVLRDSLCDENGVALAYYDYVAMLNQTYHSEPTFTVVQNGSSDGHFGIGSTTISDVEGTIIVDDIFSKDNETGAITYKYGAPLFVKGDRYKFYLKGFEEYQNHDGHTVAISQVPLSGVVVTIDNALSSDQSVYLEDGTTDDGKEVVAGDLADLESNQLALDDEGEATYEWHAGLPNIAGDFTRTISISYDIDGHIYQWSGSGMKAIILGELPTGNNFVTSGPDHLDMILRDPPGSASSAEWSTGTIESRSTCVGSTFTTTNSVEVTNKFGFKKGIIKGTPAVGTMEVTSSDDDLTIGIHQEYENESATSQTTTTTITKTISTKGEPEYVGDQGDVFIGTATNIIFGKARNLGFVRDGDGVKLDLDDVITTGVEFGTYFTYTQKYIKETLLPNLVAIRNRLLIHKDNEDDITSFVNTTNKSVYLTLLNPDDENYGKPHTYTQIVPEDGTGYFEDSVQWVNNQIDIWIDNLKFNEEEKVKAFHARDNNTENYSFDSGADVTFSIEREEEKTSSREWHVSVGGFVHNTKGFDWSGFGLDLDVETEDMTGTHHTSEHGTGQTTSYSYVLSETGDADALTVDVYNYGAFSPIFRTRAGQTSAPYEGKVVTEYFQPGTVIMEATMQIEVPQIDVEVPVVSDIPSGSAANYVLKLSNASEVGADVAYRIMLLDDTNKHGAQLTMDGMPLTGEGRLIKVPGNQTLTKALQLRQTDTGELDYEKIGIMYASDSEPDEINDVVYITAHFTPSSSAVNLALNNNIMNTQIGTNLKLTFNNFDRNYKNLKAFRLQYKKQGSTDWTLLREYVLDEANKTQNNELLPEGASIDYTLDMNQFTDGDYLFRVLSVATYGNDEVYRTSEEMALVKDMQRPRPLGQPEPADGILSTGDELSVTFNETILKGELTQAANFKVTGVLNGAEVAHETALSMQNTEATAQTEADILLGGKDFSIDTWVNLTNDAGTLLSHGKGNAKMTVGTDADNHLVVKIGSETYTSESYVPTNAWAFLTLSYKNENGAGVLNATMAKDADETLLFNNKEVVKYEGDGPLSVGKNMTGAIHELLLWDEAHDMTEALLQRSRTKNPATRHLVGYWKMDEGEGKTIRDYSRNRHMTMPAETWYMNNENKAVSLTGGNYLSIDASDLPAYGEDDYALEFWMRGDAQEAAQLLQMGQVGLWLNAKGELQLTGKGAYLGTEEQTSIATTSGKLTDNAWHHIALNVLRQGAAAVYVDGVRRLNTNAANVGSIATNNLLIGTHRESVSSEDAVYTYDRPFIGQVDEVRVWNATLNADKLLSNRKVRLTGTEDGLSAYYPFETKTIGDGNQVVTTATAEDFARKGHEALINSQLSIINSQFTDNAPALRQKKTETNVPFTFVSSNEKIVITIDEDPPIIEGCTLNFTVRDVRDENGNYSAPAVWSAFVNQNQLVWAESTLSVEQHLNTTGSVSATIVNKGGQQQMWTLTGMPAWLIPSTESGETNPLSQTQLDFTIMPSAPVGRSEVTVYLTGNDNIDVPLTLNLNVIGEKPDWAVNPNDFDGSMNVIAQLYVENVESNDPDDIVAAFIGEECRGIANLEYSARYDGYFVTMDIYANSSELSATPIPVTFRAYDASTGTLYPVLTPSKTINYAPMALEGTYAAPVKLTTANDIEQKIELRKGWNWISLYVTTDDMSPNGIFANVVGSLEEVKSQTKTAGPQGENCISGSLKTMSSGEMYAVKMSDNCTLRLVGSRANVQVNLAEGWNWIGYGQQLASVGEALSGMSPVNGDLLKGQQGVAYFDTYAWAGSLLTMQPGKGYQLKSSKAVDFTYTNAVTGVSASRMTPATSHTSQFTPIDYHRYADNMTVTAQVKMDGHLLTDAEIGVFTDDGDCRTTATISENGRAYIVIPGDEECQLKFQVAAGGKIFHATQAVNFEVDAVYGSYSQPFVIDLNDANGISEVENKQNIEKSVYDLQGRKIDSEFGTRNSVLKKGVYIVNGQKKVKK